MKLIKEKKCLTDPISHFVDLANSIKTQYDGLITPEIPSSYIARFARLFWSDQTPYQQKIEALPKMLPNWADSIKRGIDADKVTAQIKMIVSQQIEHCQRHTYYPDTTRSDIHQVCYHLTQKAWHICTCTYIYVYIHI